MDGETLDSTASRSPAVALAEMAVNGHKSSINSSWMTW